MMIDMTHQTENLFLLPVLKIYNFMCTNIFHMHFASSDTLEKLPF